MDLNWILKRKSFFIAEFSRLKKQTKELCFNRLEIIYKWYVFLTSVCIFIECFPE